jgi:uncharacterized membrane protein (DUF4010 family)
LQIANALDCGVLLAWTVMCVRVLVLVVVVNRALLASLLISFLVMAVVVAGFAALLYFRGGSADKGTRAKRMSAKGPSAKGEVAVTNPFSLTAAAKFAALFAVVLLTVKIVQQTMPPSGLYADAALSGLVDVDAITLSMAKLAKTGEGHVAVLAIVIAALSNTMAKCGMAAVLAGIWLGKLLLIATAAALVAGPRRRFPALSTAAILHYASATAAATPSNATAAAGISQSE